MNISTLIGFMASLSVFVIALLTTTDHFMLFLDIHAALIVIGGTLAASFICFSLPKVAGLTKVFVKRMLGRNNRDYQLIIREVVMVSKARRNGKAAMEAVLPSITDPFLKDVVEILFWIEVEVSLAKLQTLLETRAETHFERYMDEAGIFQTMAKFPPAFGLMGTTLGMIGLLQSLGSANGKATIGPTMALALVATLYGIVLANFVFIPIAENLKKQSKEDLIARRMVVEGIMLIATDTPSKFVEEQLKSFLLPSERRQLGRDVPHSNSDEQPKAA